MEEMSELEVAGSTVNNSASDAENLLKSLNSKDTKEDTILNTDSELSLDVFITRGNSNNENYYSSTDFEAITIKPEDYVKDGSSYTFVTSHGLQNLPDEVKSAFLKLARKLNSKGFTLRHKFRSEERPFMILEGESISNVGFLPSKKYNEGCSNRVIVTKNLKLYQLAAGYFGKFFNLHEYVRSLKAATIGCVLGENGNDPVDFILIYNPKGITKIEKKMDYKELGDTSDFMYLASRLSIPILNLHNLDETVNFLTKFYKLDD